MKTFVIGDIHGRIEALKEVLQLSSFNYKEDRLILLGDIVDGGYNTYEVVEELLKIKNIIFVVGNHDIWAMNHIQSGWAEDIWLMQGGVNTLKSYGAEIKIGSHGYIITKQGRIPKTHFDFFNNAVYYYVLNDMLFVHGGFDPTKPIKQQSPDILTWDRSLIERCKYGLKIKEYNKVFVGHTTTQSYDYEHPIRFGQLIMMDCGAGWSGRLAIMDIETEEYWISKKQVPAR